MWPRKKRETLAWAPILSNGKFRILSPFLTCSQDVWLEKQNCTFPAVHLFSQVDGATWTNRNWKNNARTKSISTGETLQTLFFCECTVRTNRDYKEPYLKKGIGERGPPFSQGINGSQTRDILLLSLTRANAHTRKKWRVLLRLCTT